MGGARVVEKGVKIESKNLFWDRAIMSLGANGRKRTIVSKKKEESRGGRGIWKKL